MTETSRPMVRIHNTETNEVIDREMNDTEFVEYQARLADETIRLAEAEAKQAQRQAIFDRLGITEEEARILLG